METKNCLKETQLVDYENLFKELNHKINGNYNALVYFNDNEESILNFYKSLLENFTEKSKIYINTKNERGFYSAKEYSRVFNLENKILPCLKYESTGKAIEYLKTKQPDVFVIDDISRVRFDSMQFHCITKIYPKTTFIFVVRNNYKGQPFIFPRRKHTQVTIYVGLNHTKAVYKLTNQLKTQ